MSDIAHPTTPPQTRGAVERLEEALANLHLMEPEDAALVVERTLEQAMRERIGNRTFHVHEPRG